MVDSPVGKKCRSCAQNKTHLSESSPKQVGIAFLAATAAAVGAGCILHQIPIWLLALPYGALVAEVALRAGKRSRSIAMQAAAGAAAFIGSEAGALVAAAFWSRAVPEGAASGPMWHVVLAPQALILTGIAVAVAVTRVRFL
jgi:hypothetical protein